ncbi:MAG: hypothetical protein IID03_04045 [Candidatus Dadabacteria bacterium]|nr:hypothetical protein [Candidatus Dadabacteria bacterium]
MTDYWPKLHDLFDTDDGSLPDVFLDGLSGQHVCAVYSWVMSQAEIYDDPTLWSESAAKDILIKEIDDPAGMVVSGDVYQFRHGLISLVVGGVEMPGLSICVEPTQISFDYHMGADWGAPQLEALFEFLSGVVRIAPEAKISHHFEGDEKESPEFAEAFGEYIKSR